MTKRGEKGPRTVSAPAGSPVEGPLDRMVDTLIRHPRGVALGLSLLHLALALLSFVPDPHPGGDNGVYVALARSLLEGGYHDLFDPSSPAHRQFPPGFPALVALGLVVGLEPWIGLKLLIVASSTAGVALVVAWIRRRGRPRLALGVGLVLAVSPGVVALSHWELSDVPFWTLSAAALLLWEGLGRTSRGGAAAAALLTLAALATRVAGLPLVFAAGVWLALGRRWIQLGILALVVLPPLAGWAAWSGLFEGYVGLVGTSDVYAPDSTRLGLAGLTGRIVENAGLYLGRFLPTLVAGASGPFVVVLSAGLGLLALHGWGRRIRRLGVPELWIVSYAAMLLVWNPEWAGERLLLPVYPLLLYYAGDSLVRLARALPHRAGRALPVAGLVVVGALAAPGLVAGARFGTGCTRLALAGERAACLEPGWRDFLALAEAADTLLPDDAIVLSRKPALFWVASGLRGRLYPMSRDPAAFRDTAVAAGARYVVLDDLDDLATTYLTPLLIQEPAAFCVLHTLGSGRATLFGIHQDRLATADRVDPGAVDVVVGFEPCRPEELSTSPR